MTKNQKVSGAKKTWLLLSGAIAFFILSVVVSELSLSYRIQHPTDPELLSTYFARLEPGDSYSYVMRSIPRGMVGIEKQPCTLRILSNSVPAYETCFSGNSFGKVEVGSLYFDTDDKLIYMTYSTSAQGGWKPNWKVEKFN